MGRDDGGSQYLLMGTRVLYAGSMNDYEMQVARDIQALEKLLEESVPWAAELERKADREAHNRWADERQPRFQQHLQAARAGLHTSATTVTRRPRPKPKRVEAWTPEAVAGPHEYVVENSNSLVGAVFAAQAAARLRELEQSWDEQMEVLYRLSRR